MASPAYYKSGIMKHGESEAPSPPYPEAAAELSKPIDSSIHRRGDDIEDKVWVDGDLRSILQLDSCLGGLGRESRSHPPNPHSAKTPKSSPEFNKFSNFNKLPIEIRLEIWRHTLQPQNIAIAQDGVRPWEFQYRFNRTFPVALHVCRESRNELLTRYTCLSLTPTRHYQPLSLTCRYVNFAIDTFIFPDLEYGLEPFFAAMGKQSQMIQSIVVGTDIYGDIGERDIKLLSKLPNLNSLRIHLGGIGVEKELLVFDPTVEHELWIDSGPGSYCWSSLLEAFRRRIAKHWPREPLPWKGFSSMDNRFEPRHINEKSFYVGLFRDWMKPE